MILVRGGAAALAILAVSLASAGAWADGLTKVGGTQILVSDAPRAGSGNQSSEPIPIATGKFVIPFAGNDQAGGYPSAIRYQVMSPTFAKSGAAQTLFPSATTGCCSGFAVNGGAKLGSKSQVVIPLFTYQGHMAEIFGMSIGTDGVPVTDDVVSLTRLRQGNQGGPVIVPLPGGTAFMIYADAAQAAGESDWSVKGVKIGANGLATGTDVALEGLNTGYQLPADGALMKDGRILAVFRFTGANDIIGRTLFYGRYLRTSDGKPVSAPFLLGANNENLFSARMRVAALPNGNFVAVWIDDRLGFSAPMFRIFSPTGEAVTPAIRVGELATLGAGLDVAALADGRFVIIGTLQEADATYSFFAQLYDPEARPTGPRLQIRQVGNLDAIAESYVVNAGYTIGTTPPTGGLASAPDARRVYVTWRQNRPGGAYNLYGQLLRADP